MANLLMQGYSRMSRAAHCSLIDYAQCLILCSAVCSAWMGSGCTQPGSNRVADGGMIRDAATDAGRVRDAGALEAGSLDGGTSIISDGGTSKLPQGGAAPAPMDPLPGVDPDQAQMIADSCVDAGTASSLELLPQFVTVFQFIGSNCSSLSSAVLVRNNGTRPIAVSAVAVSPAFFSAGSPKLPMQLAAGASFSVQLAYGAAGAKLEPGEADGTLTVLTSEGCAKFDITGLVVSDDALVTYSDYAIDFGTVPVGSISATKNIYIRVQRPPGAGTSRFGGFTASPSNLFSILGSPTADQLEPQSCDTLGLKLVFSAPTSPQRVTGTLSWEVTTSTPSGDAPGLVTVPLFGAAK